MHRRTFLKNAIILCSAPAVVRAESIMRINPELILPPKLMTIITEKKHPDIFVFNETIEYINIYDGELVRRELYSSLPVTSSPIPVSIP
jgi:hypothetical protein